jgi:UPF0755 protein
MKEKNATARGEPPGEDAARPASKAGSSAKMITFFTLLAILLVFSGVAGYAAYDLYLYMHAPLAPQHSEPQRLVIAPGDNFAAITEKLEEAGLVDERLKFEVLARWKGYERSLKAGEYRLAPSLTPLELLVTLNKGLVVLYPVTIPEGFNIRQVASRVEKAGLSDHETFLSAATDPALARELEIPADTVEGYLFPDTYSFARGADAEKIIRTMTAQLRSNFPGEWEKRAEALGLSIHEVITLASIIEKETGVAHERPLIASVFHNRLAKNMRLQTDPTVIYGIKDFDGNLTRHHLEEMTPYNTYRIRGLPPGPIANPGLASIRAALYPAETDYYYFVAKPDRTHQFSATLAEHNRAVRKYQLSSGRP